jgi:hypothetical protein
MLYFSKPPNIVVAVHGDDQIEVDPVSRYGIGTYVVVDVNGAAASLDANGRYVYPTISAAMQAASVKLECRRRILFKISEQSQRNITTHITNIQSRIIQAPPATPEEQSDIDTAAAIWAWVGAATRDAASMLGTCDALIAANNLEWYQDVLWPPWNTGWDTFVARF